MPLPKRGSLAGQPTWSMMATRFSSIQVAPFFIFAPKTAIATNIIQEDIQKIESEFDINIPETAKGTEITLTGGSLAFDRQEDYYAVLKFKVIKEEAENYTDWINFPIEYNYPPPPHHSKPKPIKEITSKASYQKEINFRMYHQDEFVLIESSKRDPFSKEFEDVIDTQLSLWNTIKMHLQ